MMSAQESSEAVLIGLRPVRTRQGALSLWRRVCQNVPPMKAQKTSLLSLLFLVLIFTLSGCVYLRLLEVKNQLADFDHHFRVELSGGHFILHFLHPILFKEDFTELTKLNPSRIHPLAEGYQWFLDFHQEGGNKEAKQAEKTIVFQLHFNGDHRLESWDFSPLFVEMAPPAFLEASIRSLGKGKVLERSQQLRVDSENLPKVSAEPPTRKSITAVLGIPAYRFSKSGLDAYVYRFKAEALPIKSKYEDRRIAEAKLYFDPATDQLAKMSSRFAGLKISIDFRKLTEGATTPP